MVSKFHLFFIIPLFGFLSGCSDMGSQKNSPKPKHVTNAEHVLKGLEVSKTSAVVFQVKPIRTTACEYMYIEFGQQDSEGEWIYRTHSISPGRDARESFGQQNLKDQLHFAEFETSGEFGVLALGCKPYGKDLMTTRKLLATFDVDDGKLNYIGEIALIPKSYRFFDVEVDQRTDFALEQIKAQMPELEAYFHRNIMTKFSVKLSPEQKDRKEQIYARARQFEQLLKVRDSIVREHDKVRGEMKAWEALHGYVKVDAPDAVKIERNKILLKASYLKNKVALYDRSVAESRSSAYVDEYVKLYDKLEAQRRIYFTKYPIKYPDFSPIRINGKLDPEQVQLADNIMEARIDLEDFEARNE
ncbi:MAG: hypothetical protein ABJN69_08410 [Hellea sp.]